MPEAINSAQTNDADIMQDQHLGVVTHLPKPVNPAEMLRAAQELLAEDAK